MRKTHGGLINTIAPASLAEKAGLRPGDRLMAINGQPLHDIIDYRYFSAEEQLDLSVERDGQLLAVPVARDYDSDLGIEFAELVFDGLRLCRNHCPFCFVEQMPGGLRPSLYIHDDDYRYSFLLGNYVTLTNLNEDDWQRIGEQGLSPLYVSIHATDLATRRQLLGISRAPDIVAQIKRLSELQIAVHGQVVIWPGVNDGEVLRQTILTTAALWPCVQTLALVPVGVTECKNVDVRPLTSEEASQVLDLADELRSDIQPRVGCTWLFPTDELYLMANRTIPPARFYDDDSQWQNGVGMVRDLLDDWRRTKRYIKKGITVSLHHVTLACGELIAPTLTQLAVEMTTLTHVQATVIPVRNTLFGNTVTVSGLLSAQDICSALADYDLGEHLFLPRVMFTQDNPTTLDDVTLSELSHKLQVPITLVSTLGELVNQLTLSNSQVGV
ncbi:MAG: DUF512 domain-containing protein [Anaerolineae bacterium]